MFRSVLMKSGFRLLTMAGLLATAAHATSFVITVDTSSFSGMHGFIDLQFNPGDPTSQSATATITSFDALSGVLDNSSLQVTGDFTGVLPGQVTALNDTSFNNYFEGLTFGDSLSFVLTLSGPAIDNPNGTSLAGSTFGLGFYDINQSSILTNDASGFAGGVDIGLLGDTVPFTFPDAQNGPSVVTIQQTPEPSTFWLAVGSTLLGVFGSKKRARARRLGLS